MRPKRLIDAALILPVVMLWAWLIYDTGFTQGRRSALNDLHGQRPTAKLKSAMLEKAAAQAVAGR